MSRTSQCLPPQRPGSHATSQTGICHCSGSKALASPRLEDDGPDTVVLEGLAVHSHGQANTLHLTD